MNSLYFTIILFYTYIRLNKFNVYIRSVSIYFLSSRIGLLYTNFLNTLPGKIIRRLNIPISHCTARTRILIEYDILGLNFLFYFCYFFIILDLNIYTVSVFYPDSSIYIT
nr:hypothetical protein TDPV-162 [Oriental turtle dovepox virus]